MEKKGMDNVFIFDRAYREKRWGGGSGPGSFPTTTAPYRELIEGFIHARQIRSVLDVGCGDWQFSRLINWGNATYVGIDVVPAIVEHNRLSFRRPGISFEHGDAIESPLPKVELVLVKDVLQHWSFATIEKFLRRMADYPLVIITNTVISHIGPARPHWELKIPGSYRPLDVRLPPLLLPCRQLLEYDASIDPEYSPDVKMVLLWSPKEQRRVPS